MSVCKCSFRIYIIFYHRRPFNKTAATLGRPHPFSTLCTTSLGKMTLWSFQPGEDPLQGPSSWLRTFGWTFVSSSNMYPPLWRCIPPWGRSRTGGTPRWRRWAPPRWAGRGTRCAAPGSSVPPSCRLLLWLTHVIRVVNGNSRNSQSPEK